MPLPPGCLQAQQFPNEKDYIRFRRVGTSAEALKKSGKIKFIGFSSQEVSRRRLQNFDSMPRFKGVKCRCKTHGTGPNNDNASDKTPLLQFGQDRFGVDLVEKIKNPVPL